MLSCEPVSLWTDAHVVYNLEVCRVRKRVTAGGFCSQIARADAKVAPVSESRARFIQVLHMMLPLKYTPYCLLQVVVSTLPWRQHYPPSYISSSPKSEPALPFPCPPPLPVRAPSPQ